MPGLDERVCIGEHQSTKHNTIRTDQNVVLVEICICNSISRHLNFRL